MRIILASLSLALTLFLTSCQLTPCNLDPSFCYTPPHRLVQSLTPAFAKLTLEERSQEWGKEVYLGRSFAKEMDFYRAITCFKSALFLLPKRCENRRIEIHYDIFLCYYMAEKYQDAIDIFETTELKNAPADFPALHDLLILLYDSYIQTDQCEHAIHVLSTITALDPDLAQRLTISTNLQDADISSTLQAAQGSPIEGPIDTFLCEYGAEAKSVSKARAYNAILPGAGYYYVGQKKAALTSLIINALFIGASYQLYDRGYIPAAIILTSLEAGWYFGGINGAGIAACEYNRCLYERMGKETLTENRLFPILMIQKGF